MHPFFLVLATVALAVVYSACACGTPAPTSEATPTPAVGTPEPMGTAAPSASPTAAPSEFLELIAYIGTDGNVYVINADGTRLQQLTTSGGNSHPAWSPDRIEVAYVHTSSPGEDVVGQGIERWEIRSVKADGSEERILVPPLEDATYGVPGPGFFGMFEWPRWSPGGDSVYFHFNGGSPGRHRLVAWSLRPLADSPRILPWEGSVGPLDLDVRSSDGALVVAYISSAVGHGVDLIDREGAESGHICGPTFEGPSYRHPRWSPDGARIALWIDETLTIIDRDCTRLRDLATAPSPESGICWSRDGSKIVYSIESDIYIVPADGSGPPVRLTEGRDPTW